MAYNLVSELILKEKILVGYNRGLIVKSYKQFMESRTSILAKTGKNAVKSYIWFVIKVCTSLKRHAFRFECLVS